jgi:hypothetical protein
MSGDATIDLAPPRPSHTICGFLTEFHLIQKRVNNPRHTVQQLGRVSCLRVPAKVKAQAEARETERSRAAGITLSRETEAPYTAVT